jgi:cold-inducible RNA-binding protein
MATKLYVGNLPYNTNDQLLADHFSSFGEVVSAKVITDKMSGRSKGFGFVEFATDAEGDEAIEQTNGQDFGGRKLVVNEAKPLQPRR